MKMERADKNFKNTNEEYEENRINLENTIQAFKVAKEKRKELDVNIVVSKYYQMIFKNSYGFEYTENPSYRLITKSDKNSNFADYPTYIDSYYKLRLMDDSKILKEGSKAKDINLFKIYLEKTNLSEEKEFSFFIPFGLEDFPTGKQFQNDITTQNIRKPTLDLFNKRINPNSTKRLSTYQEPDVNNIVWVNFTKTTNNNISSSAGRNIQLAEIYGYFLADTKTEKGPNISQFTNKLFVSYDYRLPGDYDQNELCKLCDYYTS